MSEGQLAELFFDDRWREVASTLLGTDRHEIAYRRIRRLTVRRLGSRPAAFFFVQARARVVIGLRLRDGRSVLVKVLAPGVRPTRAQRRVQQAAVDAGLPCPRPLVDRARLWRSYAIVDEFLPGLPAPREMDAAARTESAMLLARFISVVGPCAGRSGRRLPRHRLPPSDGRLWGRPHNLGVTFAEPNEDASWIDDHARRALAIGPRSAGEVVVGHGDWSAQNLGFDEAGRITAIYDFDDLVRDPEPLFVGIAAVSHPATPWPGRAPGASVEEARAFVGAYERARGRCFATAERRAVGAAALYLVAYLARSEHELDPAAVHPAHSFRSLLARHGDEYLSI